MARYRAKTLCFVDGSKIRAGQEFSTEAPFNEAAWERIDGPANVQAKPAAQPAAKAPEAKPAVSPFDGMPDDKLKDYIATKGGPPPKPGAKRADLIAAAKAASGAQE